MSTRYVRIPKPETIVVGETTLPPTELFTVLDYMLTHPAIRQGAAQRQYLELLDRFDGAPIGEVIDIPETHWSLACEVWRSCDLATRRDGSFDLAPVFRRPFMRLMLPFLEATATAPEAAVVGRAERAKGKAR